MPPTQARAILRTMEAEFDHRDSLLATKADLRELQHHLDVKISSVEVRLIRWNFLFWVTQLAAILGILKFLK